MILSISYNKKKIFTQFLLPLLFLLIGYNTLHANKRFSFYTMEDGLSQNTVDCIYKDSRGFIWIGTWNGLNRFDGYEFKTYKNRANDTNSISNNFIYTLCEDSFNNIWIGTNEGISVYIYHKNTFKQIPLNGSTINSIAKVNNKLLVGGNNIFAEIIPLNEDGDIRIDTNTIEHSAFPDNYTINDLFVTNQNNIWIGCIDGVYYLTTNKVEKVKTGVGFPDDLFDNEVNDIFKDDKNNLWVATEIGLIRYDIDDKTAFYYNYSPNNSRSLTNIIVESIDQDVKGNVIIGTLGGISIYNPESDDFTNIYHEPNNQYALNNEFVRCIYADTDGNVWIGTERGGINKYNVNQKDFEIIEYVSDGTGLNSSTVNSLFEDEKYIWIGTAGGGLNRFDKKNKQFRYYVRDDQDENSLLNNFVTSINKDKNNTLWITLWGGGLLELSEENQESGKFIWHALDTQFPMSFFISSMLLDNERIILGTNAGIWIFNIRTKKFQSYQDINNQIYEIGCLTFDNKKNLWVGTVHGLYLLPSENGKINFDKVDPVSFKSNENEPYGISNNYITSLLFDSQSRLWLGTYGTGINLVKSYDTIGSITVEKFDEQNGLSNTIIYSMLDDEKGKIWASTGYGLSELDLENDIIRNYFEKDGIINNEFYWTAGFKNDEGKMYFGGMKGVTMFYPEKIKIVSTPPVLRFTELKMYNKPVIVGKEYNGTVVLKKNITIADEVVFSYKSKEFTLQFAALHYDQPEKNKYKYILEGVDDQWISTLSSSRSASYSNLRGGEYVFKVHASNNDGVWTENPLTLKISIIPPIWKTTWFIVLSIVILIAIILIIYYLKIISLKRQKEVLEKKVEKRTAEIKQKNQELFEQTEMLNETNTLLEERQQHIQEQAEELRAQAEELSEKNSDLRQSNATKDKFFSIIAHDLKNPFTSVLGFLELISSRFNSMDDPKKKRLIDLAFLSATNIYKLLENLLQWSRSQTGSLKINKQKLNLYQLIQSNFDLIKQQSNKKSIQLTNSVGEDIHVFADENMINTIIRNLLTNAIKFTSKGKIVITSSTDKEFVFISIEDSGVGMDPEKIKSLFDIERNKSTNGTNGEGGTGLGLIVCKEFIEKNDGKIFVESVKGEGTTFTFSVPVYKNQKTTP